MNFTKNIEESIYNLHKKGAFLTVAENNNINTMTISWGNIGFIWKKPIFTVLVRDSRYTHEILERGNEFSISIPFKDNFKESLCFCGTKSGKDVDKIKECNLSLNQGVSIKVPSIKGCEMVYECRIVYKQHMSAENLSQDIKQSVYSTEDYHTIYYGEILNTICTIK